MDTKTILKKLKNREIGPEQARELLNQVKLEEDSIAIIGMSGKYAQSNNMNVYWNNLSKGTDCVTEVPSTRWNMKKYYDPKIGKEGKMYCNQIGCVDNYEYFSPMFFEITPKDAEDMDPQHRLFLTESYKAFEDAGYSQQQLNNKKCGVYLGIVESIADMTEVGVSATGSSNAIAASRIAYYLNLKGPAIAIDTACSSSGVALHLAVQALHNGEIDMALVGGTCLYLQPDAYVSMCATGMLSPKGRCKAFDNSADGFVPGEGVGALILKPLRDAKRDHDHIYGCIIASGLNQDGKTNGITAPNLESQKELVASLYRKNKIHPESISYAEFHGTGTKLGDPIELESLSKAFEKRTKKKHYCGIGSVKSNIGHTSAASSVASVQKVLLCMQHHTMVPTLHVKEPNEHYDFESSPFYINTQNKEWNSEDGNPLRACINSFGFSGTNVHIVLQEYEDTLLKSVGQSLEENLFVLSAKNKVQLKEYVKNVLAFIKDNNFELNDFFYTLQTGRTAMEERLAIVINGKEDLIQKLTLYIEDEGNSEWMLQNHLTKNDIRLREAMAFEDRKKQVESYKNLTHATFFEKLRVLAEQWIRGELIDWEEILYRSELPYRMSIPTYPFDDQPYLADRKLIEKNKVLHPLVHNNISNFSKLCFESKFTGNEFFIADHNVGGKYLLPGAAMMEMARVTGEISTNQRVTKIEDMQWILPVEVGEQGQNVDIMLSQEDDKITYKITTKEHPEDVYAQGILSTQASLSETEIPQLDLVTIKEGCIQQLEHDLLYQKTEKSTILYGNSFRGIQQINYNENEALAYINVDDIYCEESYMIAPTLLDSAMQAVSPIIASKQETQNDAFIPYYMESVELYGQLPNEIYSYVKEIKTTDPSEKIFDLVITNKEGVVLLSIHRFILKQIGSTMNKKSDMVYLQLVWQGEDRKTSNATTLIEEKEAILLFGKETALANEMRQKLQNSVKDHVITVSYGANYEDLGGNKYQINPCSQSDYEKLFQKVSDQRLIPHNIIMSTYKEDTTENRIQYSFAAIVALGNALMNSNYKGDVELLYRIGQYEEEVALGGMFKGIRKEVERFHFKTVQIDEQLSNESIAEAFLYELDKNLDQEVRITNEQRLVRVFDTITELDDEKEYLVKDGGVYLITGGLGEIGLALAKHMSKANNVHVILSGRRDVNDKIQQMLKEISTSNSEVKYIPSDITKKEECTQLIQTIKQQYGKINGVIHAAGILKDALLFGKSLDDAKVVLAPKIYGMKYLDEAIHNDELDYMILCSSLASSIGNLGQCDYCYGNAFMDNFAKSRNEMVTKGLRKGKTISINWCPWKNSKMSVSDEFEEYIEKNIGMHALSLEDGMNAFEDVRKIGKSQISVFQGDARLIRKTFVGHSQDYQQDKNETNQTEVVVSEDYREEVMNYLKNLISLQTKIPMEHIDVEESFGDYGIDSIVILSITRSMEKDFGILPKTLFFEYNNLNKLVEYFLENHLQQFMSKKNSSNTPTTTGSKEIKTEPEKHTKIATKVEKKQLDSQESIAIIGISGRYPMADNLEEFWENLKEGKDCITEIPKERWDYQKYYDPDKEKFGKSYSKWGGFINDVNKFDPIFFNVPPIEAEFMDPQVRLSLESAWNAMEDAGYTREALSSSRVGVFIGVMYGAYQLFNAKKDDVYVPATSSYSAIANRISYFFDFHGPSLAVDTMCSSSLTALHLACESIKRGEIDVAFVGGVNLSIHPDKYLTLSFGKFASSDGRCRSFGEGGDGYVPGEGVGTLILKPLESAKKDHDHVYACIKGTAINSGGRASGFTVPSPIAQSNVMKEVFDKSGIDVQSISYIETHGTGTSLGDPIEINGLMKVFPKDSSKKQYCSIGSVKSNIGHLEGAAGVASITKVILQMQHNLLVPSLHSKKLNPYIDFENSPFYVQQEVSEWKETMYEKDHIMCKAPRRAGISSFGAGGSNAHVLLEQYVGPTEIEEAEQNEVQLYLFSAKTKDRLNENVASFVNFLNGNAERKTNEFESKILMILEKSTGIQKEEFDCDQEIAEYGVNLSALSQLHDWIVQELDLPLNMNELGELHTIKQLCNYLIEQMKENQQFAISETYARNIAYMLQVGREAMEERLAICARSLRELRDNLVLWLTNEKTFTQNNVLDYKDILKETIEKATHTNTLEQMIKAKDYQMLAELWTKGAKINWNTLYEKKPYKISLPGYLFEKERYWISSKEETTEKGQRATILHPLVHQNVSDIYGITLKSEFTGEEDFLRDHRVNDAIVVPGVVFLEMARAACHIIDDVQENEYISIQNVVWLSPAVVESSKLTLFIHFDPRSREELDFKIYSQTDAEVVHGTGTILICEKDVDEFYNISTLEHETFQNEWEMNEIYAAFKQGGLEYGPYFQAIRYLGVNEEHAVSILGKEVYPVEDEYSMIPAMLDASLQSTIAFLLGQRNTNETSTSLSLPFAVEQVDVLRKCSQNMIAILEEDINVANSNLSKTNIYLYDSNGNLCVKLMGFTTRKLVTPLTDEEPSEQKKIENIMFEPTWVESDCSVNDLLPSDVERKIMLYTTNSIEQSAFEGYYKSGTVEIIHSNHETIDELYQSTAQFLLHKAKEMYQNNHENPMLIQLCIHGQDEQEYILRGLSGFFKSMELEMKNAKGQLLLFDESFNVPDFCQCMDEEVMSNDSIIWRKQGRRYLYQLQKVTTNRVVKSNIWKKDGVYLITGGAGGLGLLFANEIQEQVERTSLILVGRSEYKDDIKEKLENLKKTNTRIEYMQADLSKLEDVTMIANKIKEQYGNLDGIVHCAGIVRDNWILKKTSEEMKQVLTPKVQGTYNLDQATKDFNLDFVLLMSSSSSVTGNLGQSDYAAANGFMDCFAEYRNRKTERGERKGSTYSINWPLWREGGMQINPDVEKMIYESTGIVPLIKEDAFSMLYQSMNHNQTQVVPMQGKVEVIKDWLNHIRK